MATINDERAQLLAGQARQMKAHIHTAADLLRHGKTEEAIPVVDEAERYAIYVTAWLEDIAKPPSGEVRIRGKSQR